MVIKTVELETVCGVTSTIPDNPYVEIAFAGRSNVGKSSLINALMNRKAMAHISSKPGKTQTINFYNIDNCMYLVDLPGYGYATANVEIKAQWGKMIENYLHSSRQLTAVFLLIDIRHDPTDNDKMMYGWIKSQGYKPIIIATKKDKISKSQLAAHINAIHKGLEPEGELTILPFSAMTKEGREEIWDVIDELTGCGGDSSSAAKKKNSARTENNNPQETGSPDLARKPRWKSTGKPVAKKTQKMRDKRHSKYKRTSKA